MQNIKPGFLATLQCLEKSGLLRNLLLQGGTESLAVVHGSKRRRDKNRRLIPMSSQEQEKYFWARVEIKEFGCWNWTRGKNAAGYGIFRLNGVHWICQRFSWTITVGDIPEGMQVLHRCDNPKCVRPDHLFLGTMQDNMTDKITKNRQYRPVGNTNPKAVLTESQIPVIRVLARLGLFRRTIACIFNVHTTTISAIIRGETWRHV